MGRVSLPTGEPELTDDDLRNPLVSCIQNLQAPYRFIEVK